MSDELKELTAREIENALRYDTRGVVCEKINDLLDLVDDYILIKKPLKTVRYLNYLTEAIYNLSLVNEKLEDLEK